MANYSGAYREWYDTTPKGEKELRTLIAGDSFAVQKINERLNEMKSVPEGRCSITQKQIAYLERILASL